MALYGICVEAKCIAAYIVVQALFYPRALTVIYSYRLLENHVCVIHYVSEQWGENNLAQKVLCVALVNIINVTLFVFYSYHNSVPDLEALQSYCKLVHGKNTISNLAQS